MKALKQQSGFTLVEMAIVLVIIGILLGGVLKGQEMIESAKIKNVADQAKSLMAAIYTYQDKYGALPGDDPAATTNLNGGKAGCVTANLANGDGDGQTEGTSADSRRAAEHLACANLIVGSYDGTSQDMRHKFGGQVRLWYGGMQGLTANYIRFENVTGSVAQQIDKTLDDGVYNTGSVRSSAVYTTTTPSVDIAFFY